MPKQTRFGKEARELLCAGVDAVVNPVKVTLGPKGRNVMLDRPGQPLATRDGVTVAKEVSFLPDPFENMGAAYAREVADAAVTEAGDGTTTASVLLQALVTGGVKLVDSGAEPLQLADGIHRAATAVGESIKRQAREATPELLEQVAIISTHGDVELGKLIAETTLKTGKHGVVELAESRDHNTTVEHLEGFYFERGTTSPVFFNDPAAHRCILEKPYILISERVIVGAGVPQNQNAPGLEGDHLYNLLKACVMARRPLLIIAEDLTGDALNLFVTQVATGTLPGGCFVKLPGLGETRMSAVQDLKVAVGAGRIHTMTSTRRDDQLSSFKLEDLGNCDRAIISATRTVLVGGDAHPGLKNDRLKQLITQSQEAANPFEKEQLDHRIARLTGGVAVLRVGAHSEPEMIEKKARAEDAIHACRGALQEGVVPGGGVALLRAGQEHGYLGYIFDIGGKAGPYEPDGEPYATGTGAPPLTDERRGAQLLLDAVKEPALHIARNAGKSKDSAEEIVQAIREHSGSWGYDAQRDQHRDLYAAGVVDPAKVTMVALSKAASVAVMLLTTEVLISDIPEKKDGAANPAMFRMN